MADKSTTLHAISPEDIERVNGSEQELARVLAERTGRSEDEALDQIRDVRAEAAPATPLEVPQPGPDMPSTPVQPPLLNPPAPPLAPTPVQPTPDGPRSPTLPDPVQPTLEPPARSATAEPPAADVAVAAGKALADAVTTTPRVEEGAGPDSDAG